MSDATLQKAPVDVYTVQDSTCVSSETPVKTTRAMRRRMKALELSIASLSVQEDIKTDIDENDWETVSRKSLRTSRPQHPPAPPPAPLESYSEDFEYFEYNKELFERQGDHKRRNVKEKKRRFAKSRVKPHSDEGSNESTEEEKEEMRKSLLQQAEETPPQERDVTDNELNKLLSSISDTVKNIDDPRVDCWISHLENVIILAYQISKATSYGEVFAAAVAYIKMNTRDSIVKSVLTVIDEVTKEDVEDIKPHAWNGQEILAKWELFKANTIFTKISFLLTAAMSLSVCSIKQIEWSPLGLKLISLEAAKQQLQAVDVIDAAIHTFTWICDAGYRVFQERSLIPLLYHDNSMRDFNSKCDYVLAHADSVLAGNGENYNDFEKKVDELLIKVAAFKRAKDNGPTAVWLQNRYAQLVLIKERIVCKRRNTAIRYAPFGMGLTGSSGVGKSTLAKIVMKTALHASGFSTDPSRVITKDMFDEYDSTYTSDILGMFMDDVGNGKSVFTKKSPTDIIIKFFNNMAAQAVKAELNSKGVVFIDFKVGVLTSNFKDYNVREYTEKPEAALRRFYHTRVGIKPEFRKPGGVSLDTSHPKLKKGDLTQDVWELEIEECHIYEDNGKDKYKFRTLRVELDGESKWCRKLGLKEYLRIVAQLAKEHKLAQQRVIDRSKEFDSMKMCDHCLLPKPMCDCKIEDKDMSTEEDTSKIVPHSLTVDAIDAVGEVLVDSAKGAFTRYIKSWFTPFITWNALLGYKPIRFMATRQLTQEFKHVMDETFTPTLIACMPAFVFESRAFQRMTERWHSTAALYDLRWHMKFVYYGGCAGALFGLYKRDPGIASCSLAFTVSGTLVLYSAHTARSRVYRDTYLARRDALPDFAKSLRDSHVVKGAFIAATLTIGVKLFSMWNNMRKEKLKVEKALKAEKEKNSGKGDEKKAKPNALNEDHGNGWLGFFMNRVAPEVKRQPKAANMTTEHVVNALKKNVFWAEFTREDGTTGRCNIYFPRKYIAWFPIHLFYDEADMDKGKFSNILKVKVFRDNSVGGTFKFIAEYPSCATLSQLDMVACWVPNCPDLPSTDHLLPLTKPKGNGMCMFTPRDKYERLSRRVHVEFKKTAHMYRSFYGGKYTTDIANNGACMGPLVLDASQPCVVGFHIGGEKETLLGVMQTVTLDMHHKLVEQLREVPGVLLSASTGEIPKCQYAKEILTGNVHPHSEVKRLGPDAFIDALGSTKVRTQQKSCVVKSIISDDVADVMGVENRWGPPKLIPNWKGYNATLTHIVNPAEMFVPSKLERARQDWLRPLIPLAKQFAKKQLFRPLTDTETVLGVAGKDFLNPLPMKTGMGFPVFGPKHRHFTEVWEDGVLKDRQPSKEIIEERDRLRACWLKGERGYPVVTATLKDEPTDVTKDKVRVFQAAPVAMSLEIRKYFLPVAQFLGRHPLESECAVGVNAFSPDWEKLMGHAHKFAHNDEVIAWDYSKYDVRMNSQLTIAAWLSFIELAQAAGYPQEDLTIMRNMISDIVHPLIDYNGTMIMAYGMNTSGNNLTVNVNSTVGSFLVRMGFFNQYPKEQDFRKCVAALTYGDDFIGSVHKDYRDFDYFSYHKFLAEHNMKITPPDKSENESAFMELEDADFLKRKSVYIPEIGCSIGALDEMSIIKSLHSNLKSKNVTMQEVAISCIEGAMHEYFGHGREVYEKRRKQLAEVCKRRSLPIPAVDRTFDECVQKWVAKYKSE